MASFSVSLIGSTNHIIVHSFVDGDRIVEIPTRRSKEDFLAHIRWLERHGRREEARVLREKYS